MTNKPIRNIIFDLGGVILNIDYQLTVAAFQNLGFKDFNSLYSQARQSGLFDLYEKGIIREKEFVNEIRNLGGLDLQDDEIIKAWNAMLLDFPMQRLNRIAEMRGEFRVFLLSNTNYTHQMAFEKLIRSEQGISDLSTFFDKVYYSHQLGMRKPDREIFDFVIQNNGLKASETVFIDDSIQHVEGAKETGIQAIHLKNKDVVALIDELI